MKRKDVTIAKLYGLNGLHGEVVQLLVVLLNNYEREFVSYSTQFIQATNAKDKVQKSKYVIVLRVLRGAAGVTGLYAQSHADVIQLEPDQDSVFSMGNRSHRLVAAQELRLKRRIVTKLDALSGPRGLLGDRVQPRVDRESQGTDIDDALFREQTNQQLDVQDLQQILGNAHGLRDVLFGPHGVHGDRAQPLVELQVSQGQDIGDVFIKEHQHQLQVVWDLLRISHHVLLNSVSYFIVQSIVSREAIL